MMITKQFEDEGNTEVLTREQVSDLVEEIGAATEAVSVAEAQAAIAEVKWPEHAQDAAAVCN